MKNSIGTSITLTLAGESHGPELCVVLDGLAPGLKVDEASIAGRLASRRPQGPTDTARREKDEFRIVSGVFEGRTTGAPLTILIPNADVRSADYERFKGIARPSHADYTAHVKYAGFEDYRGGGHFSGRVTAGIVAAGAILLDALASRGILIGTHILSCAGVADRPFAAEPEKDILSLLDAEFPVLGDCAGAMCEAVAAARADGDSVGGIVQTAISGLPAGVGEPWFGSLEGQIANAVFSIGGVKGVEFGAGFALAGMRGSEANDPFRINDGRIVTSGNRNGGVNGGISNGMPVVFNTAVKPTPTISRPQLTVDMLKGTECEFAFAGRHDPAIVRRICIVLTGITALVTADLLALRYGTDWLAEIK